MVKSPKVNGEYMIVVWFFLLIDVNQNELNVLIIFIMLTTRLYEWTLHLNNQLQTKQLFNNQHHHSIDL